MRHYSLGVPAWTRISHVKQYLEWLSLTTMTSDLIIQMLRTIFQTVRERLQNNNDEWHLLPLIRDKSLRLNTSNQPLGVRIQLGISIHFAKEVYSFSVWENINTGWIQPKQYRMDQHGSAWITLRLSNSPIVMTNSLPISCFKSNRSSAVMLEDPAVQGSPVSAVPGSASTRKCEICYRRCEKECQASHFDELVLVISEDNINYQSKVLECASES